MSAPVQTPNPEQYENLIPVQEEVQGVLPMQIGATGWNYTRRASYDITAIKLVGVKDPGGQIGPASTLDLVLAWGPMFNPKYHQDMSIWHKSWNRFFYWKSSERFSHGQDVYHLASHIANVHIIKTQAYMINQLHKIPEGSIIRLKGYLVDINPSDGSMQFYSSLTRADTGGGACEIMEVLEFEVLWSPKD